MKEKIRLLFLIVLSVVVVIAGLYFVFGYNPGDLGNLLNKLGLESSGKQGISSDAGQQHFDKGFELYKADRYDEAVIEFTKTIEIDPNYPDAHHFRGESYYFLKQYDLAIADLSIAIGRDTKDFYSYYFRGIAYVNNEQSDLAIADFNKVIQFSDSAVFTKLATEKLLDKVTIVKASIESVWVPDDIMPKDVEGWGSYQFIGSVTLDFGGISLPKGTLTLRPENFEDLDKEFYFIQYPYSGFNTIELQSTGPVYQVTFEFGTSGEIYVQKQIPPPPKLVVRGLSLVAADLYLQSPLERHFDIVIASP